MDQHTPLGPATPLFIVSDLSRALAHYVERLGFACRFATPDPDPFFAMVGRDTAQIMLKVVGDDVAPLPNPRQHSWAAWDAFIYAQDPDALAAELAGRGATFQRPIGTTDDNLRGFEIADPDGYVCFFGRPEADDGVRSHMTTG